MVSLVSAASLYLKTKDLILCFYLCQSVVKWRAFWCPFPEEPTSFLWAIFHEFFRFFSKVAENLVSKRAHLVPYRLAALAKLLFKIDLLVSR